jgi:hypothetical protein
MRAHRGVRVSNARSYLCDLIKTRSAQNGLTQRQLWGWAFTAILSSELIPEFPVGFSLDTEFDHGGRRLTWRRVIASALPALGRQSANPSDWSWTTAFAFSPTSFDRWLKTALKNHRIPAHPKRHAGAKPTTREQLAAFIESEYPDGLPSGITYKQIAKKAVPTLGKLVNPRTVARSLGRKWRRIHLVPPCPYPVHGVHLHIAGTRMQENAKCSRVWFAPRTPPGTSV